MLKIGQIIKDSMGVLQKNYVDFLPFILVGLISVIGFDYFEKQGDIITGFLFAMIFSIISMVLQIGFIKLSLDLFRGEKNKSLLAHTKDNLRLVFPLLLGSIFYGIMVLFGTILLIIPGIIIGLMFFLFDYLIIDKNLGISEAFSKSKEIMHGNKGEVFGVLFVIGLVIAIIAGITSFLPSVVYNIAVYGLLGPLSGLTGIRIYQILTD